MVFSTPAKDHSHAIVMNVNQETYDSTIKCVSCASCTQQSGAPVKVTNAKFGIKRGLIAAVRVLKRAARGAGGAPSPAHGGAAEPEDEQRAQDIDHVRTCAAIQAMLSLYTSGRTTSMAMGSRVVSLTPCPSTRSTHCRAPSRVSTLWVGHRCVLNQDSHEA